MIALRWSKAGLLVPFALTALLVCGCSDAVFQPPKQQAFNRNEYQQKLQEQRQRLAGELARNDQPVAAPYASSTPQYGASAEGYHGESYNDGAHYEAPAYEPAPGDFHSEPEQYTAVHDAPAEPAPTAGGHTHTHQPPGTYLPPVASGAGAPKSAGGLKFLTHEPTGEVKLRAGVALAQTLPTGTAMMFSVDYTFSGRRSGNFGWAIYGNSKAMVRPIKLNAQGNLMTYHPAVKPADGPFECQIVEIVGSNLRPLSTRHRMK